jgi:phage N-6-adenine-methyltransferase
MPVQNRHRSIQTYETPKDLLDAIKMQWEIEAFDVDLAAQDAASSKGLEFISPEQDSLATPWPFGADLWLNPPFKNITPWVRKAAEWHRDPGQFYGGLLLMLLPAAVGSNWYRDHVEPHARVHVLNPRITYVGHTDPYPKDCMLIELGVGVELPSFQTWRWK